MSPHSEPAVAAVLRALKLGTTAQPDVFTAINLPHPIGRVFGGQVLAQVLLAAQQTVGDDRPVHSLHAYFLQPGDPAVPLELQVTRLRDGGSFSARQITVRQDGTPILTATASFQVDQPGIDNHEQAPAGVPGPDDIPSVADVLAHLDHPVARYWTQEAAFDVRHVEGSLFLQADAGSDGRQLVWMRSRAPLPDDPALHRALLAFACDQVMLEPPLRRSGLSWSTPGLAVASLDHAMWWHRPARADEWLLYVQSSPSAQGGRGLGKARIFDTAGRLVATAAQEGMVRVRQR